MRLFIIRHAKAERESDSGLDRDRTLRPRGRRQADWLAARLASSRPSPARVLSSPYARAAATAEPIARILGVEIEFTDVLAGHPPSALIDLIAEARDRAPDPLALVGHNPTLSTLACLLAEGVGSGSIALRTGEAAEIELDGEIHPGGGTLLRLLRLDES